ncbi:MAG: ABC transporter permease subunit [Euzebyales bacterium]|jgi:putative spermidine/putrescine transport system permease protein|nr:ABC transporter permease subunit [Euzebyales bacterium]
MATTTHETPAVRASRRLSLGLLLLGLLAPLVPLVIWAVAGEWRYPDLLPASYSTRPVQFLMSPQSRVVEGLTNSAIIAVSVAMIASAIGAAAGRALGLYGFRGKRLVQFLLLSPVIVPPVAATLGIHVAFIRLGLANSLTGVTLVHLIPTIPYVTLVMSSVYANYDRAYEDQARVLGASGWLAFRRVTLPQIFPGLAVAGLFAFIISWSEYLLTLVIGGGRVQTLPLLLFAFLRGNDNAIGAVLSLAFIAPALLLLLVTSKYLSGSSTTAGFGKL